MNHVIRKTWEEELEEIHQNILNCINPLYFSKQFPENYHWIAVQVGNLANLTDTQISQLNWKIPTWINIVNRHKAREFSRNLGDAGNAGDAGDAGNLETTPKVNLGGATANIDTNVGNGEGTTKFDNITHLKLDRALRMAKIPQFPQNSPNYSYNYIVNIVVYTQALDMFHRIVNNKTPDKLDLGEFIFGSYKLKDFEELSKSEVMALHYLRIAYNLGLVYVTDFGKLPTSISNLNPDDEILQNRGFNTLANKLQNRADLSYAKAALSYIEYKTLSKGWNNFDNITTDPRYSL